MSANFEKKNLVDVMMSTNREWKNRGRLRCPCASSNMQPKINSEGALFLNIH